MPDKHKKRKREVIESLRIEVTQLKAALNESRKYADKLVAHIPYLPADIDNLRAANLHFSNELDNLKKYNEAISQFIKDAMDVARQFTLSDEFPGPYRIETTSMDYKIYSKLGDIVASTRYSDFANFIVNTLNAVDKQLTLDE
jgi:hypothetical protein